MKEESGMTNEKEIEVVNQETGNNSVSDEEAEYYEEIRDDLYEDEEDGECRSCEECAGYEDCMFSDKADEESGGCAGAGICGDEPSAGIIFVVTVTRIMDGAAIGNRRMLFSRYGFAREWLAGNGFFVGENRYFPERMKEIVGGEWINRENRPDDFMLATAEAVRFDSGMPFMTDGVVMKATLG